MKKQVCSCLLMILIGFGIVMSVLNFSTKAYAGQSTVYGTTTKGEYLLQTSWWHLNNRHLGGDYYCVDDESNCAIVFAN
ncbi:MAG: hypothetical protein SCM96_12595 [Acidobacteriota bacterium]|nr:hypothetical protein [Acidobacteriota bacterium]